MLDAVGDGEAARQRSIVPHLTLLTFLKLAEDGYSQGAPGIFSPSWLTVSKALVRSTKAACRLMFCSVPFSCSCLSTKIM